MCRTRNQFPCANKLLRLIRLMCGHCCGFAIIVGNTSDFTNFFHYNRSDVKRSEVAALVCDEAA